jgi:hypothetical protein
MYGYVHNTQAYHIMSYHIKIISCHAISYNVISDHNQNHNRNHNNIQIRSEPMVQYILQIICTHVCIQCVAVSYSFGSYE